MLYNYFKLAMRNLLRYKVYAGINIIGISVGMACCFLIVLFIRNELTYDRFHTKADRIYRVLYENRTSESGAFARTPPPLVPAIARYFPEVESTVRLFGRSASIESKDGSEVRKFNEDRFFFADSTLFDVFSIQLVKGTEAVLSKPFSLLINEEMAEKYFGSTDPIGKILVLDGVTPFTVAGIFKDFPSNSHLHLNFIAPFESMFAIEGEAAKKNLEQNWVISHLYSYVLLKPGANAQSINDGIPRLLDEHVKASYREVINFKLQPLTEIHLTSDIQLEQAPGGNMLYVYLFSGIAFIIVLIACINFINLSIASSLRRTREVGVRKVLGASRFGLIKQFMGESFLISFIAFLLSLLLVVQGLPVMNNFTDRTLTLNILANWDVIAILLVLFISTALIAGSYPAFYASRFEAVDSLKGKLKSSASGRSWLRKGLITFQFAASIILISGSLVVFYQLRYLQNKSLGFDKELMVSIPLRNENINQIFRGLTPEERGRMNTFEETLLTNPRIEATTLSFLLPGQGAVSDVAIPEGRTQKDNMYTPFLAVDYDFIESYGLDILYGRGFSKEYGTDHLDAFVLNESAARSFGWEPEEAVGKKLTFWKEGRVVGVVKDFHYASLREPIRPLIMGIQPSLFSIFSVRIRAEEVPQTLAFIESTWKQFFPEKAFTYTFLNEELENLYRSDQRLGQIINAFALLAVFISCMGLFGLVSYAAEQRAKEIGIRKVLGASVNSIVMLLSKEFLLFIAVAMLVAWPIAWYALDKWLQNFAYRIDLVNNLWVFLVAGIAALFIALITLNLKAIRAALVNPARVLRTE